MTDWYIPPCRCEMLYILDQRLKAQSIAEDKSCRVRSLSHCPPTAHLPPMRHPKCTGYVLGLCFPILTLHPPCLIPPSRGAPTGAPGRRALHVRHGLRRQALHTAGGLQPLLHPQGGRQREGGGAYGHEHGPAPYLPSSPSPQVRIIKRLGYRYFLILTMK